MKAFPQNEAIMHIDLPIEMQQGMDLRDYFAAKALQSILTDKKLGERLKHDDYIKFVTEVSYEYADAMMEARND